MSIIRPISTVSRNVCYVWLISIHGKRLHCRELKRFTEILFYFFGGAQGGGVGEDSDKVGLGVIAE